MTLRKQVQMIVAKAIDGSLNYSGEDKKQNADIWANIAADNILGCFLDFLPPPVDIKQKYELHPTKGLPLTLDISPKDEPQLSYMSQFAEDNGWNYYRYDTISKITGEYDLQKQMRAASISSGDNNE